MKIALLLLLLVGCATQDQTDLNPVVVSFGEGIDLPVPFFWGADVPPEVQTAVSRAMTTWEEATKRRLFVAQGYDEMAGDDYSDPLDSLDDDVIGIYAKYSWEAADDKLASTLTLTVGEKLLTADIMFNMESGFGDARQNPDTYDLESVALHELGHLLGLGHSEACTDAMSRVRGAGEVVRQLSERDLRAFRRIYD